jgi:hypothetical protein
MARSGAPREQEWLMAEYEYVTVNVFTDRRFGGNPLAVLPDARGLSDADMQKIAREFNYSETTFILPPDNPKHTARVRIFTPACELPFAGHPNVGTGYVLATDWCACTSCAMPPAPWMARAFPPRSRCKSGSRCRGKWLPPAPR